MSISLPSIRVVAAAAQRSAQRFPFVLASALLAAIAAVVLIGADPADARLTRLVVVATLGIPLFFAVTTASEMRGWHGTRALGVSAAAMALLAAIAFAWGEWTDSARAIRYALFSAAFHLSAAFMAFVQRDEPNGFWQFNRLLFLRMLTAALYVAVLFAGLAAALGAIDVLFKAGIPPVTYGRLFVIDALAFGTWFFVGGLPEPWSSLNDRTDYPDGLRKFAQFVLIPLVVIYLLILTTYLGKVLITHEWPNGWIGYLVSFVTVTGMLAWLLVRPLEERAEFAWVRGFTRGFFIALSPSIVMLWMALGKRVGQYGLTERRYIALAGAAWLTVIALYYVISRSRNIKIIPMTLCACVLLVAAGPVSAFTMSRRNQQERLARVLTRNGLLQQGKLARTTRAIPDSDATAISEGVWYLRDAHGPHALDAWLSDSVLRRLALTDTLKRSGNLINQEAELIVSSMGLPMHRHAGANRAANGVVTGAGGTTFSFGTGGFAPVQLTGFEFATSLYWTRQRDESVPIGDGLLLQWSKDTTALVIMRDSTVLITLTLDSTIARAQRDTTGAGVVNGAVQLTVGTSPTPRPPLIVEGEAGSARVKLLLTSLLATRKTVGSPWRIGNFNGMLLLTRTGAEPKR